MKPILLILSSALICLSGVGVIMVGGNTHKALVAEQEKTARYEIYLRSILHGETFSMDKRDNWLVGEGISNATVRAHAAQL